jgi:hypothetical protein
MSLRQRLGFGRGESTAAFMVEVVLEALEKEKLWYPKLGENAERQ